MPDINMSATGIQHILSNLKPHKAAGPDTIPPTVLKELSHQISSMLEIIFNKSNFNLKPHKAAGPDTIPPTVLKELSHQISSMLEIIFNKSLQTGHVPNDWKEANVAPIFKKGDEHNPCNYRPVSLTCIINKCIEHILVINIMQHLDSKKILYALQHGFRKNSHVTLSFFPSSRTCPATPHKLIGEVRPLQNLVSHNLHAHEPYCLSNSSRQ